MPWPVLVAVNSFRRGLHLSNLGNLLAGKERMDDRVFVIAIGGLFVVALGQITNASNEAYIVIGMVYTFLSTYVAVTNRKNGNGK